RLPRPPPFPYTTLFRSFSHVAQLDNTIDVYQARRTDEPHVQRWDEALAAREHLGVACGERRDGVLDGLRPLVRERRRLHRCSNSHTRAGVSGSSISSTPSASATAFAIATGTLIVFPSPTPFAPSGVNGDAVSR